MRLKDALCQIQTLDDDAVIYARRPWMLDSDAEIGKFVADFSISAAMKDRGFDYFLEVSVAKEVLDGFERRYPTDEERCVLLIYYAENDAFPQ